MKKHLFFLLTLLTFGFVASCSSEQEIPDIDSPLVNIGEKVTFSFTVELESEEEATRAVGDAGFGNGNKINNLVYALYTQDSSSDPNVEGEIKPVKIKDKNGEEQDLIRVNFEPKGENQITIPDVEIVKGIEYTLMLWAQYRPEDETENRIYFELGNNGIIRILSDRNNPFPNNDDQRDVFCAVYKIVQYEDTRNLHLTLRRPFAQINIGAPADLLKWRNYIDENGKLLIDKSAITISGEIANRYNLFKNRAEKENNESYIRSFGLHTLPSISEDNGYKENSGYQMLKIKDRNTNEESEYIWLSMCYVLPDGKLGDISTINIDEFTFTYDKEGESIEKSITDLRGIPVLRNRRTNIILQGKDFGPWYEEQHLSIFDEKSFNDLIGTFINYFPQTYTDDDPTAQDWINKVLEDYKDNIILDDEGNHNIMIGEGTFNLTVTNNGTPILAIHRNFILFGCGDNTIIIKKANTLNGRLYHNIGQVRNLHIKDYEDKNHIFIDEFGFVTIYDDEGNPKKTDNRLEPLSGNNRSYNVYCDNGDVNPDPYFH